MTASVMVAIAPAVKACNAALCGTRSGRRIAQPSMTKSHGEPSITEVQDEHDGLSPGAHAAPTRKADAEQKSGDRKSTPVTERSGTRFHAKTASIARNKRHLIDAPKACRQATFAMLHQPVAREARHDPAADQRDQERSDAERQPNRDPAERRPEAAKMM